MNDGHCQERSQPFEQRRPTPCGGVSFADQRYRKRPRYREAGVVVGHCDVCRRIVLTIDAITHIRALGECLESVQETGRNVEMREVHIVEPECLLPTERRRLPANIDQDIVDRTMGAPDQLRLTWTRPSVHAANHTTPRPGLRILQEVCGQDSSRSHMFIELAGFERASEEASVVTMGHRPEHPDVRQFGGFNVHAAILAHKGRVGHRFHRTEVPT